MRNFKRAQRTTMTWRFVNELAPFCTHYLPVSLLQALLVEFVICMFRGKVEIVLHLMSTEKASRESLRIQAADFLDQVCHVIKVERNHPQINDDCIGESVYVNGNAITLNLKFSLQNGQSFTHAAMMRFIWFVNQFADPAYRKQYSLPSPSIVQETMIEAHAFGNWMPIGEFLWEGFEPKMIARPLPQ